MALAMDGNHIIRLIRELWGNILDHLDNPQDRLNFLEAADSRNLNSAFADKKRGWLFATTLPIIMKQAEQWNRNRILACQQAFMKCRLVSRDCFRAVDKYIEDYWDRGWDDTFPLRVNNSITVLPQCKRLIKNQDVCKFFDKIKHHSLQTCPIVTKELAISHTISFSIAWLLERIGPLLRSVFIVLNHVTEIEFVQFIEKHLPLIENVKSITVEFQPILAMHRNRNRRRQAAIQMNQPNHIPVLPNLPFLTNLSLQIKYPVTTTRHFDTHLQTYFSQLQVLTLDLYLWKKEFNGSFPNLKKLMLRAVVLRRKQIINKLIELFRNLTAPQLQLVRISKPTSTYVYYYSNSQRMKWNFLKEIGLFFLSRKYPEKEWQGVFTGHESVLNLFNSKQITVNTDNTTQGSPKQTRRVFIRRRRRQQRQNMCTIL